MLVILTTKSLGISYGGIRYGCFEMSAYAIRTTLHSPTTTVGLNLESLVHLGEIDISRNL